MDDLVIFRQILSHLNSVGKLYEDIQVDDWLCYGV